MCLSNNIRYLRKRKEMSQEALADYLGYKSYTTIQKWEMGVSEPPIKQLRKMAELFDVDMDDMAKRDLEHTEKEPEPYYLNDDARDLAQFLFENPEYRVLFDASRKVKKEDLEIVKELLDRFS